MIRKFYPENDQLRVVPSPSWVKGALQIPNFDEETLRAVFRQIQHSKSLCGERPRGGRKGDISQLRSRVLGGANWYWCV